MQPPKRVITRKVQELGASLPCQESQNQTPKQQRSLTSQRDQTRFSQSLISKASQHDLIQTWRCKQKMQQTSLGDLIIKEEENEKL